MYAGVDKSLLQYTSHRRSEKWNYFCEKITTENYTSRVTALLTHNLGSKIVEIVRADKLGQHSVNGGDGDVGRAHRPQAKCAARLLRASTQHHEKTKQKKRSTMTAICRTLCVALMLVVASIGSLAENQIAIPAVSFFPHFLFPTSISIGPMQENVQPKPPPQQPNNQLIPQMSSRIHCESDDVPIINGHRLPCVIPCKLLLRSDY